MRLTDDDIVGLDPPTLVTLSPLLHNLAKNNDPRLLLALRPQDLIPEWITHLIYLNPGLQVASQGPKEYVLHQLNDKTEASASRQDIQRSAEASHKPTISGTEDDHDTRKAQPRQEAQVLDVRLMGKETSNSGEPLVEMENVQVQYGDKQVLGGWVEEVEGQSRQGLSWIVRRGQRWGIFGPNGECHKFNTGRTLIIQDPVRPLSSH